MRGICGVQLSVRKTANDLMLMLVLNKTVDQLVLANSLSLCDYVL